MVRKNKAIRCGQWVLTSVLLTAFVVGCQSVNLDPVAGASGKSNARAGEPLKESASFPIGVESETDLRDYRDPDGTIKSLILAEFNSSTAQGAKMSRSQWVQGQYDWTKADSDIGFANNNGLRVHAHVLIYYADCPPWYQNIGSKEALEYEAEKYIRDFMTRYGNRIASVDVTNELFDDNGNISSTSFDNIQQWRQLYNSDDEFFQFIGRCFQWTRQYDPTGGNVKLFYNDYGQEYSSAKRNAIGSFISKLQNWGYPVDGVGLQMHITTNNNPSQIQSAVDWAVNTGLLVHISELDVSVNPNYESPFDYSDAKKNAQAQLFRAVATIYRHSVPANKKWGITFWDVSDADSWIPVAFGREDYATMFDKNYQKKLGYYGVLDGLTSSE